MREYHELCVNLANGHRNWFDDVLLELAMLLVVMEALRVYSPRLPSVPLERHRNSLSYLVSADGLRRKKKRRLFRQTPRAHS